MSLRQVGVVDGEVHIDGPRQRGEVELDRVLPGPPVIGPQQGRRMRSSPGPPSMVVAPSMVSSPSPPRTKSPPADVVVATQPLDHVERVGDDRVAEEGAFDGVGAVTRVEDRAIQRREVAGVRQGRDVDGVVAPHAADEDVHRDVAREEVVAALDVDCSTARGARWRDTSRPACSSGRTPAGAAYGNIGANAKCAVPLHDWVRRRLDFSCQRTVWRHIVGGRRSK